MDREPADTETPAIELCGLSFSYPEGPPVLRDLHLSIPRGVRCLLIGANGAGKTTLLRVIGGKHLLPETAVRVLGEPAFHSLTLSRRVAWLGGPFPFNADVSVGDILSRETLLDPGRVTEIMGILDIDPDWHMNRVSDGQRRRVQVLLHLALPLEVILLDEVTADLDVVARADLLSFLRDDADRRGATILYATHVLDGLERWATHLLYLRKGRIAHFGALEELEDLQRQPTVSGSSRLLLLCERWLRAERGVDGGN